MTAELVLQTNLYKRDGEIIASDHRHQQPASLAPLTEPDIWLFVTRPRLVFLVSLPPSAPADCVSLRDATVASNHNLL